MTALNDFFTYPWIKILLQEHLYTLEDPTNANRTKDFQRPFRAYVKEVYGGDRMVITDGFSEVVAKLMPGCKTVLKEKYPSFCQSSQSLTSFLIAIRSYKFSF